MARRVLLVALLVLPGMAHAASLPVGADVPTAQAEHVEEPGAPLMLLLLAVALVLAGFALRPGRA